MTGEKKVSKEGVNNIYTTGKKLSRNEAAKKYQSLSIQAKEDADSFINAAFYQETGLKPGTKLDPQNHEHSKYIEKWLNHRDRVMGWGRDWEKRDNLDTRIFRDKTTPTPRETLRKSEGIFDQRLSGTEFKEHVQNRLLEAATYKPSELRKTQRRIALGLTSKLMENETWLKNALETRAGRDGLRILEDHFLMKTIELEDLTAEEKRVYGKLSNLLKPYDSEVFEEKRINRIINQEVFKQTFPKLREQLKTKLELQGYQVEKIYYKKFLNHVLEIRAETTKKVHVGTNTYGFRGDPYVNNFRTERKNFSLGGINLETGKFIGARFFNKHGTIITDWDTQLAIGELAVLAGVAVKATFSGVRSIILKTGEKTTVKVTESLAGKQLRDTAQDLGETIRFTKSTLNETGDTLQDLGATLRGVRVETSDTVQDLGNILRGPRTRPSDTAQDVGSTLTGQSINQRIRTNFDEGTRSWIGDDIINSASDIGLNQETLSDYFEHLSMRVVKFNQKNMLIGEGPGLIQKTALEQIQKATTTLGTDRARTLVAYGMDPLDISNHIDDLVAKGYSSQMIRDNVSNEIKLMDHLRDNYLGGSQERARAIMSVHGRSPEMALKSRIQENLMREYKLANPDYHELPSKILANKWLEQSETANKMASDIRVRVLGSASAGVVIYKRPRTTIKKGETKPIKVKEKPVKRETRKKIRENMF